MRLFRRIWRAIVAFFSFGLVERENESAESARLIDEMRKRLAELKSVAAAAVANECRLDRLLDTERQRLARLDGLGPSDQLDSCRSRLLDLEVELASASDCASEARHELEGFQAELDSAKARARSARVRCHVAALRAQLEQVRLDSGFDDGLSALERLERKADAAQAEAEALKELNIALGRGEAGFDETDQGRSGR